MKITLVQAVLAWENRTKNLEHLDELLRQHTSPSDLILLPEMFSTGFTMKPEQFAEESKGEAFRWMQATAKARSSVVCGSVSTNEDGRFYNRLYWVRPDGSYEVYDKRHLFRMGKEHDHYSAGTEKLVVQLGEWKVCPMVCYDLRFPVWSRNRFKNGTWDYDLLIYIANWPQVRSQPWKTLLAARAIENQCYVAGLNRVGKDGNEVGHSGDSRIIDPRGNLIAELPPQQEIVRTITLDFPPLQDFRKQFPVGLDADDFSIT